MRREWNAYRFYYLCHFATLIALGWWLSYKQHLPWTGVAIAILAVLAVLMSVHPDIRPRHKFIYFALMAALLITEFRAMRKDREEVQEAQEQSNIRETLRLKTLLDSERTNTKTLLDQENFSLSTILKQDDTQFASTISTLLKTHSKDEKEFAGVLRKQDQSFEEQRNLSEEFHGRLVPGNDPTPANGCFPAGQDPPDGQVLVMFGDNGSRVAVFPDTILTIGEFPIISIDRVENSNAIALSLDLRDEQNRIAFRMDKNGVANRIGGLIFLHPNKSTLLIQDAFGNEFLRVTYINPKVLRVQGKAIYCGKTFDLQNRVIHNSCASYGGKSNWGFDTAASCPMPPQ